MKVETVHSVEEARMALCKDRYDIIVSDYQMPGEDGIQFLKSLRTAGDTTPFILFTGKGREEIAIEAFDSGADFYIQKGGETKAQFADLDNKIKMAVNRQRADKEIIALNRLYSVLSASNRVIVRVHDKKRLLSAICRINVEIGGFSMAWAGIMNPEKHMIEPISGYGLTNDHLDPLITSTGNELPGQGPTGTAYRTGMFYVCNDIANCPMVEPWREVALGRGFRSVAAFPFALGTDNAGVITMFASGSGFFTEKIIRLLNEQSGDLTWSFLNQEHEEQRISVEHDLQRSELQYRRLFEAAQDGILILDYNSEKIMDANRFILDLTGYSLDETKGKYLWELGFISDIALADEAFSLIRTKGYVRYENIPLRRKNGETIPVEFVSNCYMVEDTKIVQCNIRDIIERERVERALSVASHKLNLLSSITRHDINNQLTVLSGNLGLLEMDQLDPASSAHLRRAEAAVERIAAMIQFTKEYEDIGVNAPVWQDVRALVDNCIDENMVGQIRVVNDIPGGIEIFADPLIIKVFHNLSNNAVQHGENATTIHFSIGEHDGLRTIVCEDDGKGIAVEMKDLLFTNGSRKDHGFGLFLSREILAITDISINEEGKAGRGAKFVLTVPINGLR